MNRRNFIKSSSVAGISVAAFSIAGCTASTPEKNKNTISGEHNGDSKDDFALNEITIASLQDKMQSGEYTSRAITQLYLDRIQQIDKAGPKLNAVIEINPDALSIADAMDKERKAGKIRGPLHGIPVLIKDNIDTADKMQTTAGALALEGNIAKRDAFIVDKLRISGAVLLGKTNLSEWANFRSTSSCSGWSSRGGQTKSPYILDHNPCGSSSGSGVAVAANLCAVAIGTETDGSITCPASVNGVVGIKPTVGLLSRSGIIPISSTQDTAGPLARTVTDAAILLGALTGVDTADPVTANSSGKAQADYTSFLKADGLKGKNIGIDRKRKSTNQHLEQLLDDSIALLKQQGANIIEVDYLHAINELGKYETEILQCEFKDGVNKYLANGNISIKTLKDVIAYNIANEEKAMPYFKQEQLENCEKKNGLNEPAYKDALLKGRDAARKIIDDVIAKNKLDAIAGITMGPACSIDVMYGDRWGEDFLTQPAAMTGYPHISVPCGMANRLPVGLSFFGAAYTEPQLLAAAYCYEQASKKRVVPGFIKAFLD
ncbi:MAG: amidase [Bacteroidetes bacterium]|nr:amidase [Bacteroidota bacterium]